MITELTEEKEIKGKKSQNRAKKEMSEIGTWIGGGQMKK
jgi:hypothetical protein